MMDKTSSSQEIPANTGLKFHITTYWAVLSYFILRHCPPVVFKSWAFHCGLHTSPHLWTYKSNWGNFSPAETWHQNSPALYEDLEVNVEFPQCIMENRQETSLNKSHMKILLSRPEFQLLGLVMVWVVMVWGVIKRILLRGHLGKMYHSSFL